jgi:Fe-S cluster biogenesis protein NfuA
MGFYIHVQDTPNPNAVKFISFYTVKSTGKSNYKGAAEAEHVPLARALFELDGVEQLYLFDNYITVSKRPDADWSDLSTRILDLLQRDLPVHDPDFLDPEPEEAPRPERTPEIAEIEEILDRTVKPYLAADGGGIEVVERTGNRIFIKYQGACGTCPSSIGGTLIAIQNVLRDELGPDIEVIETSGLLGQLHPEF